MGTEMSTEMSTGQTPHTPAPIPPGNWQESLSRVLRQPQFVLVAIVLLVAAVGLNASVQFMKLHFKKEYTRFDNYTSREQPPPAELARV